MFRVQAALPEWLGAQKRNLTIVTIYEFAPALGVDYCELLEPDG